MPTAAQIAAQRKRARRELEQERRERDKSKLKKLREHLRHAKKLKRHRLREVVIACKQARERLRARRHALRARYLAELAAAREQERLASRARCDGAKNKARAKIDDRLKRAAAALAAEHAHQAQQRVWSRPSPLRTSSSSSRRADSLHESDSQVQHNLPADLVPVWRAVRARIKGSARRSRTEAFLEWVQEHRGEVRRILDKQIDKDVQELVRHEAELRARVVQPKHYKRMTDRELLADVPF
jgi:hypothetical protein